MNEAGQFTIGLAATDKEETLNAFGAQHFQKFVLFVVGGAQVGGVFGGVQDGSTGDDDLKGGSAREEFLSQPFNLLVAEDFWEAVGFY